MTSANYGRMRIGRCVQETFDNQGNRHQLGCAEDIIRYLLFRSSQRVLQLGNVQCPLRVKPSCADDIGEVWKNETWKMCPKDIRWPRKSTRFGMWGRYNKVFFIQIFRENIVIGRHSVPNATLEKSSWWHLQTMDAWGREDAFQRATTRKESHIKWGAQKI